MRHAIDPKIDCVFKALLGSDQNRNLLLHFLNAFLAQELQTPLVFVDILNPYNEKEFVDDKISIVDIKARDKYERLYQIEIQLNTFKHLPKRILYNWADIYSQQLQSGKHYRELNPYMDSSPIAREIYQKLIIPTEIKIAAIYSVS